MITLITGGNMGIGLAIAQALLTAPLAEKQVILITSRRLEMSQQAVISLQESASCNKSFAAGHRVVPFALDVDDDTSVPHVTLSAYRASTAALNIVAAEWRLELRSDGFKVHVVRPGFAATTLGGIDAETQKEWGAGDAADSGKFIREVIAGKRDAEQDRMIDVAGVVPYCNASCDLVAV